MWNDERGAAMTEYALLMAFLALGTLAAITALSDQITTLFQQDLLAGSS